MAHTLTTELSLVKPTSGTHEPYSITNENANLDTLDGLFNTSTGHDHSGAHKGAPVTRGTAMTVTSGLTVSTGGITVTAGGETITAGGLTVTAGNVGIGAAPLSYVGLYLASTINTSGGSGFGSSIQPTVLAGANSDILYGIQSGPTLNVNSKTGVSAYALNVNPTFSNMSGTTAVIVNVPANSNADATSNKYGIFTGAQTGANLNNYGAFISAPSGASGNNRTLHLAGTGNTVNAYTLYCAGNGDVLLSDTTLATNATVGFVFLPQCAGAPTGTPTNGPSATPMVIDTTNSKIMVRIGGTWKGVTVS